MTQFYSNLKSVLARTLLLAVFVLGSSTTFFGQDANEFLTVPEFVFQNPVLVSGTANKEGAIYRFPSVSSGNDALVKLAKFSGSNVVMSTVDNNVLGWPKAFQPEFGINPVTPNSNWWIDFELTFVKAGTNTPVVMSNFQATSLDVDGDGYNVSEYVQMRNAVNTTYATTSYLANNNTTVWTPCPKNHKGYDDKKNPFPHANNKPITCTDCSGNGKIWYAPHKHYHKCNLCDGAGKIYSICLHEFEGEEVTIKGPVDNFVAIDTSATQVMANYTYRNLSLVTFRIGATSGAKSGGAGVRLNSLWFKGFSMAPPMTLPVKVSAFAATMQNNIVNINWTAQADGAFDHFAVQRSLNGKDFSTIGVVLPAGNESATDYAFKDGKLAASQPVYYYRLMMVDKSGETLYSQVRIVRTEKEGTAILGLSAYPNPVQNELRLTLPASWAGKKVQLQIATAAGQTMQSVLINNAHATEAMNVQNLPKGLLIVSAQCEGATAHQQLIKN